jgi:hypothetical protein
VNTSTKCKFIDSEYGEFWSRPKSVLSGRQNPKRTFIKFSSYEVEEKIRKTKPHVSLDHSTYKNTHTKCKFIDSEYGEFWSIPNAVMNGHDCKLRGLTKNLRSSINIEQEIQKTRNYISLDHSIYKNVHTKCRFIDKEYGEFFVSPASMLRNKEKRHPNSDPSRLLSPYEVEKRIQIDRPYISLDHSTYVNTSTKCMFIDEKHGSWFATPNNVLIKKCGHPNRISRKLETKFSEVFGIERYNKVPNFLKSQDKQVKPDFKLNENVYIETNGLFWHSEKRLPNNFHYDRWKLFNKYNKTLLQFREDEVHYKHLAIKLIIDKLSQFPIECKDPYTITQEENLFDTYSLKMKRYDRYFSLLVNNEVICCVGAKVYRNKVSIEYISLVNCDGFDILLGYIMSNLKPNVIEYIIDYRFESGKWLEKYNFKQTSFTIKNMWVKHNKASLHYVKNWYKLYDAGQSVHILKCKKLL